MGLFDPTTDRTLNLLQTPDDDVDPLYEMSLGGWANAVKRLTFQIHEETNAVWQRQLADPFDLAAVLSAVEHVVRLVDAARERERKR